MDGKKNSQLEEQEDLARLDVREPVLWFTYQMELKLRKHGSDWGPDNWKNNDFSILYKHLLHEGKEFIEAWGNLDYENMIREAADIGSLAMMLADNARRAISGSKLNV